MTSSPDPSRVPAYPVLNLELHEDDTVSLDGRPVAIGMDQAPTDAGVHAVAAYVRNHSLGAVRVRATSPTGTHLMVVTAQAQAHDLALPPGAGGAGGGRPRRGLAIATLAAMAAVLGLAGTGVWAASRYQAATEPAPTVTGPPGQGANVPVPVPPGYATKAHWSLTVAEGTPVLLRGDGSLVITGADDLLRVIDPATGLVTWRGSRAPAPVHLSTVEGRPVLAAATSQSLHLWPLDVQEGTVTATTVDLSAQADVSYLGPAPLVVLDDQTVALLTDQGVIRRDVPVGATPVMATDAGAIATDATSWWLIAPDAEPEQHTLPRPPGATGAPRVMSAADATHLIGVWRTSDPALDVVALLDLTSATATAHTTVRAGTISDRDEPVRDAQGASLTLGPLLVDVAAQVVVNLGQDVTPAAVTGRTVYATQDRAAVVVDASNPAAVTVTPYTDPVPGRHVLPAAATSEVIYILADKVDRTLLYALPRLSGGQP